MPLLDLPTRLVCLSPKELSAQYMGEWLKSFDPPIIVRVEDNNVLLDDRTIQDNEMKTIVKAIRQLAEKHLR